MLLRAIKAGFLSSRRRQTLFRLCVLPMTLNVTPVLFITPTLFGCTASPYPLLTSFPGFAGCILSSSASLPVTFNISDFLICHILANTDYLHSVVLTRRGVLHRAISFENKEYLRAMTLHTITQSIQIYTTMVYSTTESLTTIVWSVRV